MKSCIFLDKDGTLVKDIPYNVDISKISFYADIFEPLRSLAASGYSMILISNQSGLGKGLFHENQLRLSLDYIIEYLSKKNIPIQGYYYCPHNKNSRCLCRKPLPGLLQKAAHDHDIDLSQSWMIGDILADVGAGRAAGCKTILMDRSRSERRLSSLSGPAFRPDYILDSFEFITNMIVERKQDEYTK